MSGPDTMATSVWPSTTLQGMSTLPCRLLEAIARAHLELRQLFILYPRIGSIVKLIITNSRVCHSIDSTPQIIINNIVGYFDTPIVGKQDNNSYALIARRPVIVMDNVVIYFGILRV